MRVLVLGASGFVGQHVVRTLLERATHEVWSASRSGTFKVDVSRAVACDVEDEESLRSAIEASRCDLVVNLAGVYAWWLPDPDAFERVNVQGVRNLLSAVRSCAGRSPRLVHVSTVLAYGRPEGLGAGDAFDEDSPVGPTTSRYAASKQAGDLLVQAALESGDVAGSACYLACCIGADQKCVSPDRDVMRIADLISGAVPATIASDAVFTYVSVRDAAEAIARVGERACASGGGLTCRRRYLVGEGRLRTDEYYGALQLISGTPKPKREVPGWVAMLGARVLTWYANNLTGSMPTAPVDLVRTATSGTLLFDASRSTAELGMQYAPIKDALVEAIDFITERTTNPDGRALRDAEAMADARVRLLETD